MPQREGGTDAPSSYEDAAPKRRCLAAPPGSPSSSEESCGWTPPESTWPFLSGHFPAARLQHVANRHIFNAGLCTSDRPDAPTVRVVAADFADVSDWFMGALRQRDDMASSGSLDRVLVPCDVGHGVLQDVVNAMYQGCITIDKDSFAPLLQLGDALLMPALTDACAQWALQALQQEDCSSQWASQLHGVLGALQVKLPNVERAMLEAVVARCLPAMHAADLQVLAHMLTDPRQKAAARCDCTAKEADAEMVEQLRSCLQTLFGPNWPEVFLLLLLLGMDQLGLPVGPLAPHLNADCLHPADVRAVVQHVLGPDAEQLRGVVEVVHMLLKAAVEPAATGSLLHVAHAGWCQASTGAPVVLQLPTQFGPAKLTVKKRSGAIHISLETPARVMLPQICDYLFLYTINAAGMRLHKFDRRSHNARATRDVTTLEIAADSSSGVSLAKDVVWGAFLMVHDHDRSVWYI